MKQDVLVELYYDPGTGADWQDHTDDVLVRDGITITRGKADEQQQASPPTATLTFNSWEFNPRNPASSLYGLIGRNTPLQITVDGKLRFVGEVASWTPRQSLGSDLSADRWVFVVAAGITRRLRQGADPLHSVIRREVMSADYDSVRVAYWPCEDPSGSTALASGIPDAGAFRLDLDDLTLASYEGFPASEPLPTCTDTTGIGSGPIPRYSGDFFYWGLFAVPSGGLNDGAQMAAFSIAGGTVDEVELEYSTGGGLQIRLFDEDDVEIDASSILAASVDDSQFLATVRLEQSGADINWHLSVQKVTTNGQVEAEQSDSGTFTGLTMGTARRLYIGGFGTNGMSFGHQLLGNSQTLASAIADALAGWAGEHAGRRIQRLCKEEGVAFVGDLAHDMDDTIPMGPQQADTFLDILRECAETDRGLLIDGSTSLNDVPALNYRPHRDIYNQTAGLELDYATGEVAPPLDPVLDDQQTRNDIIVNNRRGGEDRAVRELGPLSVQLPPDGVGRYRVSATVNTMHDSLLEDQAGWRLHLGTVDEIRYPQVTVDLDATPDLATAVGDMSEGDRILITSPPDDLSPDDISLIVLGWVETVGSHRRKITFNCVPEEPYHIAEVEHTNYSYVGSGSEPAGGLTLLSGDFVSGTDTTMDTFTALDSWWTGDNVPFDILVGGVRLRVTAVNDLAGDIQFVVDQTPVNGVIRTIPDETPIDLFHKSYIGL